MLGSLARQFLGARTTPGQPISFDVPWVSGGVHTAAGIQVTPESALSSSAVLAAFQRISFTVGRMPKVLYKRSGDDGRERATAHPLYSVIRTSPNPEQSATSFWTRMVASILLYGNAYAYIERNVYGQIVALWHLKSRHVQVLRENGLRYVVESNGQSYSLLRENVLHIPGWAPWGLLGESQVMLGREAIGVDMAMKDFRSRFFANDARPGLLVKKKGISGAGGTQKIKDFLEYWKIAFGGKNRFLPGVIDAEEDIKEFGLGPAEAQIAEGQIFQVQEICRITGLQPHMIAELSRATFSNIEAQGIDALNYAFGPWVSLIEEECTNQLLLPKEQKRYFIEMLMDALQRGDIRSRYAAYAIGWNRWLTTNEIRRKENLNPLDGGDEMGDPMGAPTGANSDTSDPNQGGKDNAQVA